VYNGSGLLHRRRVAHASRARRDRATNRGRRHVRDAEWTRLIDGAGVRRGPSVSGGVREGERKVGQRSGGPPTCRPG
jgi:hypothetical protein